MSVEPRPIKPRRQKGLSRLFLTSFFILAGTCLGVVLLLIVLNATRPTHSTIVDRLSQEDKARLAEAFHLRQTLGDQVMPGWAQAEIPVILYNEGYLFLVGCPDPQPGWIKIPQGTHQGQAWEMVPNDDFNGQPYYRQKLPAPGVNSQAFTVQVGDQWVASLTPFEWMRISMADELRQNLPAVLQPIVPAQLLVNLLIPDSDSYITLVLHETAHAYQGIQAPSRLVDAEQTYSQYRKQYPWKDAAFQSAWKLEMDLLNQALRATTQEESQRLARAFLEQRAKRREAVHLSADLIRLERSKEWEEGIAKYSERSMYVLAANQETYQPIPQVLADAEFNHYRSAQQKWDQEVAQMRRMLSDDSDRRFYYTGFAQAVLLDRLSPGWKDRLFEDGVWLEELLAEPAILSH